MCGTEQLIIIINLFDGDKITLIFIIHGLRYQLLRPWSVLLSISMGDKCAV